MSLRKACGHYAPHTTTYDYDDIPIDEAIASMITK